MAVVTTGVALLPIVFGTIVTTTGAGMAFADWPTSDGHSMFFYPWLKSAGDKFLEHGHRLAGIAIGICSILLARVLWVKERRRWVKLAGCLVLLGVILQGILGGMRVLYVDERFGLVHGSLAALVFSLMTVVALVTSRSWIDAEYVQDAGDCNVSHLRPWAVMIPFVIFGQYVLGGLLRHLGRSLHEHIAVAILVLLFASATAFITHRSGVSWLKRPAYLLLGLVLVQICLGMLAFVTKYGFAPSGYVAVHGSVLQTISLTVHTIVGMLVLMTSVIYSLRVFRLNVASYQVIEAHSNSVRLTVPCSARGGIS
jgi:cytochrome c oxidase assembly protein subunit 15